jgi:hypothetical protein
MLPRCTSSVAEFYGACIALIGRGSLSLPAAASLACVRRGFFMDHYTRRKEREGSLRYSPSSRCLFA